MKCILPCAGYATRLFPLTENFPKALLEIAKDKPILDYIIEEVNTISEVDEIYVISNHRYMPHFEKWMEGKKDNPIPITVIDDQTSSLEDRLGAIGDIAYAINYAGIDDDLLIIAGDNLFTYPLKDVLSYYHAKGEECVSVGKHIDDIELLKGFAVASLDPMDRLLEVVEKPNQPKSDIGIYATYVYPRKVLAYLEQYLKEGNKTDSPGYLLEYLYKVLPVYIYQFEGACYDIGTPKYLDEVRALYGNKQ